MNRLQLASLVAVAAAVPVTLVGCGSSSSADTAASTGAEKAAAAPCPEMAGAVTQVVTFRNTLDVPVTLGSPEGSACDNSAGQVFSGDKNPSQLDGLELKPGADLMFGGDVIYVYRGEKHGMKVGFSALGQFEGLETESLSGVVIKVFPTRCQVKLAAPKHDHKDPAQKTSLADGLKALRVSMGTEKPPEFPPPAPLTPEQQKKQDDAAGGCHPAPGAVR